MEKRENNIKEQGQKEHKRGMRDAETEDENGSIKTREKRTSKREIQGKSNNIEKRKLAKGK